MRTTRFVSSRPRTPELARAGLALCVGLALASHAVGQSGGHRHVGPVAPGWNLTPKVSPLLNIENGRWDLGEALSPNPWVERGGVHGPDPDPSEAINHVVPLNGGWQPLPGTSTQHFIGELRPSGVQTPEPSKEAASFEIVVPGSNFPNPSKPHTVVVIAARPARAFGSQSTRRTRTSTPGTRRTLDCGATRCSSERTLPGCRPRTNARGPGPM